MSAPAQLQSSVHSASELIECHYMLSPKEPCHFPVTDIQKNGDAVARYTQCQCRSGYTRHLLSYWPSLWVTAEIWSVMWQNKSVSQRLLARSRGGVHYNWFYRCPSILCACVCVCVCGWLNGGWTQEQRNKKKCKLRKEKHLNVFVCTPTVVMCVLLCACFIAFCAQQTALTTGTVWLLYTSVRLGRVFPRRKEGFETAADNSLFLSLPRFLSPIRVAAICTLSLCSKFQPL